MNDVLRPIRPARGRHDQGSGGRGDGKPDEHEAADQIAERHRHHIFKRYASSGVRNCFRNFNTLQDLASARERVVLKWPLRAKRLLASPKPSHQFAGKTVRYEVFLTALKDQVKSQA